MVWRSLSVVEKGMIIFTLMVYVLSAAYGPSTREKTIRSVETGAMSPSQDITATTVRRLPRELRRDISPTRTSVRPPRQ